MIIATIPTEPVLITCLPSMLENHHFVKFVSGLLKFTLKAAMAAIAIPPVIFFYFLFNQNIVKIFAIPSR